MTADQGIDPTDWTSTAGKISFNITNGKELHPADGLVAETPVNLLASTLSFPVVELTDTRKDGTATTISIYFPLLLERLLLFTIRLEITSNKKANFPESFESEKAGHWMDKAVYLWIRLI